jgi:hypothetical protein
MGQIIKDQKDITKKISYEDISTDLENNPDYSYSIDNEDVDSLDIIKRFLDSLENFLKKEDLSENEIKLGQALQEIFLNYDKIFVGTSNNKFNKNVILLSLREMTNLTTKEIRSSIKKFKNIYLDMIQKMIKD